jgi:ABC-type Na+ efflux pump permease subunit
MPTTGFDGECHARRLAPAGGLLVTAGVFAGGLVGSLLVIVGGSLLLLACVSARDGLLVVGPFARAEAVAAARGGRPWLWRAVYVGLCGAGFVLFFRAAFLAAGRQDRAGVASYAESFFLTFAGAQFVYLTYLAAALVSPVVAEEREKRRWEMLLTSDLRNREVLLGKVAGRLPTLFEPVLACLPVLAALPFLGGVPPVAVGCAAVVTLAAVAGTAAVAAFTSVTEPTAEKARNQARGLVWAYFALSGVLLMLMVYPPAWTFPTSVGLASPVEVRHAVGWANAGNPFGTGVLFRTGVGRTGDLEADLLAVSRRFAGFWLGVTFLFGLTAIARLRASRFAGPPPGKPGSVPRRHRPRRLPLRPPVTDRPVEWWERWGRLGPVGLAVQRGMTGWWYLRFGLVTAAVLAGCRWQQAAYPHPWFSLEVIARVLVPFVLLILAATAVFAPAFAAAASIARERSADTLEALRLTTLTAEDVVGQKWAGAVRAALPAYLLAVKLAAAAVVTSVVPWWSWWVLPLVALLVPPLGMAAAGFALPFGARAADPGKATRNMSLALFGGGYLLFSIGVGVSGWLRLQVGDAAVVAFFAVLFVFACGAGFAGYRVAVRRLEGELG